MTDLKNMPPKTISQYSFQELWEECKKQSARTQTEKQKLDDHLQDYSEKVFHFKSELNNFREYLRQTPIAAALGRWMQGFKNDPFWQHHIFPKITRLLYQKIIPLDGTLEYLIQRGHQEIIENIRCCAAWTLLEKEESVSCYVEFSHALAEETCHLVRHGYDPDRDRVRYKAIKYEPFIDFVQRLSDRDALIAKLIYFGNASIEDVLSLKVGKIDLKKAQIAFPKQQILYPKHIIQDLTMLIHQKKRDDLVFVNVRGEQVDRAHLNHAFARASNSFKITPGSLLKMENSM